MNSILIAPDSFKESLTAMQVSQAIQKGLMKVWPDANYQLLPVADGGEGTVQSLVDASHGEFCQKTVRGPMGEPVSARYGLIDQGDTAVIEMAEASGLHLVERRQRNPLVASSFGTGELIVDALNKGVSKLIIGLGGSATNDAGRGMLAALGVKFIDADGKLLPPGGAALSQLAKVDASSLDPRLAKVELQVACDVDNPLCGARGASAVFGPQKGANDAMVEQLDKALMQFAKVVSQCGGPNVANIAGAGAAGGMGAGLLAFTQAQLRPGIDIVTDAVSLKERLKGVDLVVTGEGRIDAQTVFGKTPVGVARHARELGIPVIAICGSVGDGAEAVYEHGIDAVFDVVPGAMSLEQALADGAINLERCAENLARAMRLSR